MPDPLADGTSPTDCERTRFLERWFQDQEQGHDHPVEHYLAAFPAIAAFVRSEHAALQRDDGAAAGGLAPGSVVGRYRIGAPLRGGLASVYEAVDTELGRRVVVKTLRADLPREARAAERLRREARVLAALDHPNVVKVLDLVEGDGVACLVMPFVEGRTLAAHFADAREQAAQGPAPAFVCLTPTTNRGDAMRTLLRFFCAVAEGLECAHRAGVVHRDVKPENLMVAPGGAPVVLDFGLAQPGEEARLTTVGEVVGTPLYMAPEQVEGLPATPATDIYALGVVLYEALTLVQPFAGAGGRAGAFRRILAGDVVRVRHREPRVARDLEAVVARAIECVPARRYATMGALAADLRRVLDLEPTEARPISVFTAAWRRLRRPGAAAGVAAVVFASVAAVFAWRYFGLSGGLPGIVSDLESGDGARMQSAIEALKNLRQADPVLPGILTVFPVNTVANPDAFVWLGFPAEDPVNDPGGRPQFRYRVELLRTDGTVAWQADSDTPQPRFGERCHVLPCPVPLPEAVTAWRVRCVAFTPHGQAEVPLTGDDIDGLRLVVTQPFQLASPGALAAAIDAARHGRATPYDLQQLAAAGHAAEVDRHRHTFGQVAGPMPPASAAATPAAPPPEAADRQPSAPRPPLLDAIRSVRLTLDDAVRTPGAAITLVPRVVDLCARLRDEGDVVPRGELAWSWCELAMCLELATGDARAGLPLLDECAALLARRGGPRHGDSQVLRLRSRLGKSSGDRVATASEWQELWRSFDGPKRILLAAEAGRLLTTLCDEPERADVELSAALQELAGMPPWDEATRRELVADPDFSLKMPWRGEAATWQDLRGTLLALRGFAREQYGCLVAAIADFAAAEGDLATTGNVHGVANCNHDLAAAWLQLGRYDAVLAAAQRARAAYQFGFGREQQEPDENGLLAMDRLVATALHRRGLPEDVATAARMFASLWQQAQSRPFGETNIEALTEYAGLLLELPAGDVRRGEVSALLDHVARYCGERTDQRVGWLLEILRAEQDLARGDATAARARLAALESPLRAHRATSLQVRRGITLARVEAAAGAWAAGMEVCREAAATMEQIAAREGLVALDSGVAAYRSQFRTLLAVARSLCAAAPSSQASALLAGCHDLVQRFHGFSMLQQVQDGAPPRGLGGPAAAVPTEELAFRKLLATPPRNPAAARKRPGLLHDHLERLDRRAAAALPSSPGIANALRTGTPASLQDVQHVLAANEMLIECIDGQDTGFALVVTAHEVALEPLPGGAAWHDAVAAVAAWSRDPESREVDVRRIPCLQQVAALLLPTDGWLATRLAAGTVRTILWSPEGTFARLPLAALPWRDAPLVATVAVQHVVSSSVLVHQRTRTAMAPGPHRLLALGNPRDKSAGTAAPSGDLEGAAAEVLAIAAHFATPAERERLQELATKRDLAAADERLVGERFRVLLGAEATEGALRGGDVAEDVVHFACHGQIHEEVPGSAHLQFAGTTGERGAQDGRLYFRELAEWSGDRALVVLAACRTAVGGKSLAADPGGLAVAAQLGGARRVLATLWPIGDRMARDLLVDFHAGWLARGEAPVEALAAAQRAVVGRSPVAAWSAFVLWGGER